MTIVFVERYDKLYCILKAYKLFFDDLRQVFEEIHLVRSFVKCE